MMQRMIFKLSLTLARNHPDMYDEFMRMTQQQVAEFINVTYGTRLKMGTSWDEVDVAIDIMNKRYHVQSG